RIGQWASMAWKRQPRPSLVAGSLLVLLTLFLNTAQLSCKRPGFSASGTSRKALGGEPATAYRPGYELILDRADWPTSVGWLFSDVSPFENSLGRWMYAVAELLAITALGSIIAYQMHWKWVRRAVPLFSSVSMVTSLYLVTNYASSHLLGFWNLW